MAGHIIEKKREDESIIYRVNRNSSSGFYRINSDSWQRDFIKEIKFKGFTSLPSGFRNDGRGMTYAGGNLLKRFHGKHGNKLCLCVVKDGNSSVKEHEKSVKVVLNHDELRSINSAYRNIKQDRNRELDEAIATFLKAKFPKVFTGGSETFSSYVPGTIGRVLDSPEVLNKLSAKDKQALQDFFPSFIKGIDFSLRSTKNIKFTKEGLGAAQTVYLEKIVEEYEQKLKKNALESTWQKLLREHILLLLHSYSAVIEKQSVDIDGKFPDFMLVDPYGYLDIYEIKKPQTEILKHDASRDNYYWSTEICKAISQVENYIDQTTHHRLEIAEKIRKKEGHQIKIVRPRGFIIAGIRTQLQNEDMEEDFRILNDSLKNIDIIFYDDLLGNLKALLNRFSDKSIKTTKKKSAKKTE